MSSTILDTIVASVRSRLAERKRLQSIGELEQSPLFDQPVRSLSDALRQPNLSIIAEMKRASPSQGVIRESYDPREIANSYQLAGANAVSVLTEKDHFLGALEHLEIARSALKVPILRKDFILDPYQIVEARAAGADAVLLIATILDRHRIVDLLDAACAYGVECLVELYSESELDRIDMDRVTVLGVNNRNLSTFEVDVTHAGRVLSKVPDHIVRVAESGLRSAEDLVRVRRAGIDAVLIGETFMRKAEPGMYLLELRNAVARLMKRSDD